MPSKMVPYASKHLFSFPRQENMNIDNSLRGLTIRELLGRILYLRFPGIFSFVLR